MMSTTTHLLLVPLAAVLAWAAGCPSSENGTCEGSACTKDGGAEDDEPPRFYADPPFGVGFSCVTIGCDTEKPLVLENQGGGRLGIALVRTSLDTSADFTVRRADGEALPRPDSPHVLRAGEQLELVIRYVPADGVVDTGAVAVEHWDAARAYEESVPLEDEIALTARAVGAPVATLPSPTLDFGYVPAGASRTLEVVVENHGTDGVLAAGPLTVEDPATADTFVAPTPSDWSERFANAGSSTSFPVSYAPATAGAHFGALRIATNDPALPVLRVAVKGTAIAGPRLSVVEPAGDVVLAPMRLGETRAARVVVRNDGGQPLDVAADIRGGAGGFAVTPSGVAAIAPLAEAAFEVTLTSQADGAQEATLTFTSNDPAAPSGTSVRVAALVNAPRLRVEPGTVQFGAVVQSWVAQPQPVVLSNDGFGELTISALALEVGSSQQVQIVDAPALPLKLVPGEEVSFTAVMTALALGPVTATVLVTTDAVDAAITRVPVVGDVITCQQGCPTANGTPDCSTGACRIGSCLQGWHDPNVSAQDGCECSEDLDPFNNRTDVSQGCPGRDLGTLYDNSSPREVTISGTLHSPTDVDLVYFQAKDNSQFLNDSFGVVVRLLSGPPGLLVCANVRGSGSGCGGLPTTCSGSQVADTQNGAGDDSRDVTVFVKWAPDAQPMCGPYTLQLRADAG